MSIENRLVALERSAARWRVAAVVLGCGLLAVLSGGADVSPVQDNVFAHSLVIMNAKNEICGTISGGADGGRITLNAPGADLHKSPIITMSISSAGALIAAADGTGASARVGTLPGKGAVIEALGDKTGRYAGMYGSPIAGPSVSVTNTDKSTATLGTFTDDRGGAFIDVSTAAGSVWHEPHAAK